MSDPGGEEVPQHEGPDPRHWPDGLIGERMEDLRVLQDVIALLGSKDANFIGPHYQHATAPGSFLASAEAQAREALAAAILSAYGIGLPGPGEETAIPGARPDIVAEPFPRAGKARAFGVPEVPG